jgi:hypothetical protein
MGWVRVACESLYVVTGGNNVRQEMLMVVEPQANHATINVRGNSGQLGTDRFADLIPFLAALRRIEIHPKVIR